jgi:hypothetical protein
MLLDDYTLVDNDLEGVSARVLATFIQGRAAGRSMPPEPAAAFLAPAGSALRHAAGASHRIPLLRAM